MGKTIEDIEKAAEISVINTGKISFPYINAVLSDKGSNAEKKPVKKSQIHDFPEREYDYEKMLSDLRKKQNN